MNISFLRTLFLFFGLGLFSNIILGQSASVSPSRLYYNVAPGSYKSQTLRVTNNGNKAETFTINFVNFDSPGNQGKTAIDTSSNSARGMADWLTASPSFFEVLPGETKNVEVLLQVPNTPEANSVRWAVASVKLSKENKGLEDKGENVTGMAILPSFNFMIHLFQTPPTITYKEVAVKRFEVDTKRSNDSITYLLMEAHNVGDAIADCAPYLDMVNLQTGKKYTVKGKAFSLLPGGVRELPIQLPQDLPKGKYNILGIVDYNSDSEVAGMEMEYIVK